MKINAISLCKSNYALKNNFKNNSSCYVSAPSFEGIFDIFKKQPVKKTVEQQESDDINDILKSSIIGDKALKNGGRAFFGHLKKLLNEGAEKNYKGYLTFNDAKKGKNVVTFGDIDENTKLPSTVNVWQEGKLKTVYEIDCPAPQLIYSITTYDDNRECFYRFINDKNLSFQSIDKDGIIVAQYPAVNGFCQQQSKRVNDNDAILYYELYWDYKDSEKSYFLQNTEGDAVRYGYDKKNKFWYEKDIIPYDKKDEIQTYTSEN